MGELQWEYEGNRRGPRGREGKQGLPGFNSLPADQAMAEYVAGPDTLTYQALNAQLLDRAAFDGLVASLAASFRPQPGMWAYGHSFLAGSGLSAADYYVNKLGAAFGMNVTNRAQGGTLAEQAAWRMWAGSGAFPAGHTAIVILQLMMNSMRLNGNDAATKRGVEWAWRTCATMASAKTIVPYNDPRLTYSGTWAGGADAEYPGGGYRNTNVTGAYVEFTTQTPAKGTAILALARKVGLAANQIEIRNITAGSVIRTWNNVDQAAAAIPQSYAPASILLDVPAGTVVRFTNTAGTGIFVGLAELEQVAPKPILAVKEPKLADWSGSTLYPNGSDAATDAFNALVDTVAADFPNMIVVNPDPYWTKANAASLVQGDKVHPNRIGNDRLMMAVASAAARWSAKASATTSGVLSGSATGCFTPAAGVTVAAFVAERVGGLRVMTFTLTGSFPAGWATNHVLGSVDPLWRPATFATVSATAAASSLGSAIRPDAIVTVSTTGDVALRHDIGAVATHIRFAVAYSGSAS